MANSAADQPPYSGMHSQSRIEAGESHLAPYRFLPQAG
jgi:hypothetical protein